MAQMEETDMRSSGEIAKQASVNKAAVLHEYQDAVDSKNTELALRILRANPDVFALTNVERIVDSLKES